MADKPFSATVESGYDLGSIKEAVCIDAYRVYDSCGDKDCLEDLRVLFTDSAQAVVDQATNIRIKNVEVINVYTDLEPVPFHKGFYTVDLTFFFGLELDTFIAPTAAPCTVCGIAIFNKKCVLYGGEGNVKVFSSDMCVEEADQQNIAARNLPRATVQVADPVALGAKICERIECCPPCCRIPDCICKKYGGDFSCATGSKDVFVTLGIFTIVQIERSVQMLVPSYDFCIPERECSCSTDDPCEMFSRIEFPVDEFFPPRVTDGDDFGCGCCKR